MSNKTPILLFLGGTLLAGIIFGIGSLFVVPVYPERQTPETESPSNVEQPSGGLVVDDAFSVRARDGARIKVRPFGGENAVLHELYNFEAADAPYSLGYWPDDHSFTITLFAEPLAEVRRAAEEDMMRRLDIDQKNMCRLNYGVYVPIRVNEIHSGVNLGFSFCPGATEL